MHCMLDLETLSTGSHAAICTLGAIVFEPQGGAPPIPSGKHDPDKGEFYRLVSLESSIKAGLKMDPPTVLWWMQQPEEARAELAKTPRAPLGTVLSELSAFIRLHQVEYVWSHGATFDIVILANAYGLFNGHVGPTPWKYSNVRDTRTAFDMLGIDLKTMPIPEGLPLHHALGDAWRQAIAVQQAYQRLEVMKINQALWAERRAATHEGKVAAAP